MTTFEGFTVKVQLTDWLIEVTTFVRFYCKGTADWLIEVTTFVGFTVNVQLTG